MSYTKIWIHLVFGTKNREHFLYGEVKDRVIKHICENALEKKIYINSINGVADHLHCLISLGAEQSIAKIANLVKGESSYWINKNGITKTKFEWANEYYAISVSESKVEVNKDYINNQEEHHRKRSFGEECEDFIRKYGFEALG